MKKRLTTAWGAWVACRMAQPRPRPENLAEVSTASALIQKQDACLSPYGPCESPFLVSLLPDGKEKGGGAMRPSAPEYSMVPGSDRFTKIPFRMHLSSPLSAIAPEGGRIAQEYRNPRGPAKSNNIDACKSPRLHRVADDRVSAHCSFPGWFIVTEIFEPTICSQSYSLNIRIRFL